MDIVENSLKTLEDLKRIISRIEISELDLLKKEIFSAERLFFTGRGRSLLIMKSIAMRFMQFGFEVYLVGETNTPAFRKGDLLLAASASGETEGTLLNVRKAKNKKGRVAAFTGAKKSTLAELADVIVQIPAENFEKENKNGGTLPGGSYFETGLLVLGDNLIINLAAGKNIETARLFELHANLE
ncbi:3-hexulose-6-phosphate isomerase [Halanaerobium saccharolyticum]|uniref:3-hexulose-6-phosphate isomerase n=1 Tax=Halanaerobium saccharolyticum TaxID=43595 RepID=A0A4R6LP04_9FIRM|nr:6-phospho-3-hexuloisomerase [Halanaerobium saccharolyticum]TDO85901.1 3-hexulose-6-phosphate isomerase [Halanaerobium saccharolyticum]